MYNFQNISMNKQRYTLYRSIKVRDINIHIKY